MVLQRCPLWIPLLLIAVTIVADGKNNNNNMHSVIYRGCSDEEYNQGSAYESNLNALLDSIVSQGAYFYNGSVGVGESVGEGNSAAYGVFQCRGDLSNEECVKCKQSIVAQATSLCGSTVAARVQLRGCYLRYENSDFLGTPEQQHLVYKACSPETTTEPGFFYRRDNVLTGLEEGSFSGNNFRVTSSGDSKAGPPVYGYAQCEGDLSWTECADCVFKAATDVKDICAASVAGQVYLQKCYVTYTQGQGDDAHEQRG
ncbi:hypothetical protein KI387_036948, partial [Taxus chinensis]